MNFYFGGLMKNQYPRRVIHVFSQFGKDVALVTTGTFVIHTFVKILSVAILENKNLLDFNSNFFLHLFSYQMIPNLIVYGTLISILYYLFQKSKKMMMVLNENEIRNEREQAVMQTSQQITAMMVDYISGHNADIREWVEKKKDKGQQVPAVIEQANQNIGMALNTMSEVSFVLPYLNPDHSDVDDYTEYIENNLKRISSENVPAISN